MLYLHTVSTSRETMCWLTVFSNMTTAAGLGVFFDGAGSVESKLNPICVRHNDNCPRLSDHHISVAGAVLSSLFGAGRRSVVASLLETSRETGRNLGGQHPSNTDSHHPSQQLSHRL